MILAVVIPQFRLAAALSAQLDLWDAAVFLVDDERGRVIGATPRAQEAGVRTGQTVLQARACSPDAVMLSSDAVAAADLWERMLDALDIVSPFIEDGGAGTAFASLPKTAPHGYFSQVRTIAGAFSMPVRCGVASNRWCAHMLALTAVDTVCPRGRERSTLANLPVRFFPNMDPRTLDRLQSLGIHTMGAFAELPKGQLVRRFGTHARTWHDLAHGIDERPFAPRVQGMRFEQHGYDDEGIASEDRLAFALREITARLARDLHAAGRQCARLRATLILEDRQTHVCDVGIAHATAQENVMFHLLQARLEHLVLTAPIIEIRLAAELVGEAGDAENAPAFFHQDRFDRGALDVVLARLEALTKQPVQKFVLETGARIDAGFRLEAFRRPADGATPPTPGQSAQELPPPGMANAVYPQAAIVRPPRALTVRCDAVGLPVSVDGVAVVACAGPWKICERRWSEDEIARDEFDVLLQSTALWRIGREAEGWHLYACYD